MSEKYFEVNKAFEIILYGRALSSLNYWLVAATLLGGECLLAQGTLLALLQTLL